MGVKVASPYIFVLVVRATQSIEVLIARPTYNTLHVLLIEKRTLKHIRWTEIRLYLPVLPPVCWLACPEMELRRRQDDEPARHLDLKGRKVGKQQIISHFI